MFSNDQASLTFHKQSLKGTVCDYVIRFKREERNPELLIPLASDIVSNLIKDQHKSGKKFKGHLVVLAHYTREPFQDEVKVYHPSYQSEMLIDTETFFSTHMLKIAQRMDNFNQRGSNLVLRNITEIHLHINCVS